MEVLRTISMYAESKSIPFLLIGGNAMNFYGLSRQTGDIDLLVRLDDKDWWEELFVKLKYQSGQNDNRFARFRPPELGEWPIDLMFVDAETFSKLDSDSCNGSIGLADVKVVSPRHLATLKIHALKYYQDHRYARDYNDVLWLLKTGKTDLTVEDLQDLCERYADGDLFKKLKGDWEIK